MKEQSTIVNDAGAIESDTATVTAASLPGFPAPPGLERAIDEAIDENAEPVEPALLIDDALMTAAADALLNSLASAMHQSFGKQWLEIERYIRYLESRVATTPALPQKRPDAHLGEDYSKEVLAHYREAFGVPRGFQSNCVQKMLRATIDGDVYVSQLERDIADMQAESVALKTRQAALLAFVGKYAKPRSSTANLGRVHR